MKVFSAAVLAVAGLLGCASAPNASTPLAPRGEVVREVSGEIIAVNDVTIDLSQATRARTPTVPLPIPLPLGIIHVPVRVPAAGTARATPGEEITVRLPTRETIVVVQERSEPPLAAGERVRVLYEREDPVTGTAKMRIERE